jgi:hypothetical protein
MGAGFDLSGPRSRRYHLDAMLLEFADGDQQARCLHLLGFV